MGLTAEFGGEDNSTRDPLNGDQKNENLVRGHGWCYMLLDGQKTLTWKDGHGDPLKKEGYQNGDNDGERRHTTVYQSPRRHYRKRR